LDALVRTAAALICVVHLTACLGSDPATPDGSVSGVGTGGSPDGGGPLPAGNTNDDGGGSVLPTPLDGGTVNASVDLAALDLGGFTNCYGVAICDPGAAFCIRFWDGSQAAKGNLVGGPACYEPTDTCANQGQPMNCSCIQADTNLGVACMGSCVDHQDGTYDCYKQ
jgi:hypothetical protein